MVRRALTRNTLAFVCLLVLAMQPVPIAQGRAITDPDVGGCEREIKKLGLRRLGEKIRQPSRTRYVPPTYPPLSESTTGGGVWVGEVLIDASGRVARVWTIREVKLTPQAPAPALNTAIADAVAKWEFSPAAVDDVPVPICWTVTVNVNLDAIRNGR